MKRNSTNTLRGALALLTTALTLQASLAATQVQSADLDTTGNVTLDIASGDTLEISGKITGTGLLTTSGSGTLVLSNPANDWSGGLKVGNGGKLELTAGGTLGSGTLTISGGSGSAGYVTFAAQGARFENTIAYGRSGSEVRFAADTVLAGEIKIGNNDCLMYAYEGVTAVIEGNVTGDRSRPIVLDKCKGSLVFKGEIKGSMMFTEWNGGADGGTVYLCNAGNAFASLAIGTMRYVCSNENVLAESTEVAITKKTSSTGELDLNGFDQTVKCLSLRPDATLPGSGSGAANIRSALPATLTVKGDGAGTAFSCGFAIGGKVSLVIDSGAAATNAFVNRIHGTEGTVTVAGGCLHLTGAGAAFTSIPSLTVESGAEFICDSDASNPLPDGIALSLAEGSRFALPAGTALNVSSLTVGGEKKGRGVYTAAECPEIVSGTVIVDATATVDSVWTGGAADDRVSSAGNWSTGEIDFGTCNVNAEFASGGDRAVFDRDVFFAGMLLSATNFSFEPGGGSMVFTAESMAFAESEDNPDRTFAFSAPMVFNGDFSFVLPAGTAVRLEGEVSSPLPSSRLSFNTESSGSSLTLAGATIARNMDVRTIPVTGATQARSFAVESDTCNAILGELTLADASQQMMWLRSGSELVVGGGFNMKNGGSLAGGGRLVVTNSAFSCPAKKEVVISGNSESDGIPTLVFAGTGNSVNLNCKGYGGTIDCRTNGAFDGSSWIRLDARWNGCSILRLNSTTQTWSRVSIARTESESGIIAIECGDAAMIRVTGDEDSVLSAVRLGSKPTEEGIVINGGLSIEKSGSGTLAISNCTFRAAGSYSVKGGTLALGRMTLNPDSVLDISGDGVISVADGVKLQFAAVCVDGVRIPWGVHSHATAPAALKARMAQTTGRICIPGGTVMIIR